MRPDMPLEHLPPECSIEVVRVIQYVPPPPGRHDPGIELEHEPGLGITLRVTDERPGMGGETWLFTGDLTLDNEGDDQIIITDEDGRRPEPGYAHDQGMPSCLVLEDMLIERVDAEWQRMMADGHEVVLP